MTGTLQAQRRFSRADEVEIAKALLDDISQSISGGEALVADRGELYAYRVEDGLWHAIPVENLVTFATSYAGTAVKKRDRLRLSYGAIRSAIRCAKDVAHQPGFFDSATRGIAFRSSFVAVDAGGELREVAHAPGNRATSGFPFEYKRSAPTRFLRFLDEIFQGNADKDAKIALLGEFLGAALTGVAARFQRALVLIGEGANGKSTLVEIACAMFPPETLVSIPPQDMSQPYARAMLARARLNTVSEMPEADILRAEAVKAILAGDEIMGRHPYERPFRFRPTAGHVFAANTLPAVADQSHGFWRRILVLSFPRVFTPGEQDTQLARTIILQEIQGVVSWALDGAARLLTRGQYDEPASSTEDRQAWQLATDQILQYLTQRTGVAPAPTTSAMTLYRDYALWAALHGHSAMSSTKFFSRLKSAGHAPARLATGQVYQLALQGDPMPVPAKGAN